MHPKLGQAIVTNTNGHGPAIGVVQVDGTGTACAVGIELDSILTEADPVSTTCIYLRVVWSIFWSTQFKGVCLKVNASECVQSPYSVASFKAVLFPVFVTVLPEDAVSV